MTKISVFESLVPAIEQMYRSTIQIVDYYGSLAANSSVLNSINYNSDEQSDLQQQIYDVDKDTLDTRQQMYDVDKNTSVIQQQIYNEAKNIFGIYSNNSTVAEKQGDLQQQIYDSDKNILDMGSDNTFVAEKQRGLQQQKYDVGSDTYGAIDDNTVIIQKQRVLAEDNFDIGADSFENRSGDVQAFEPYALDAFYGDMGLGTFGGMADEIAGVTGQVDALAYSFDNVAIGMQNIAATMLLVNSASGSLAGGLSLVVASPELLGGLSTVCNSIINIAAAMYGTGGAAAYMATVTSLGYNEFKKYDNVSTTFSDVADSIANVVSNLGGAVEAFGKVKKAQEEFCNAATISSYFGLAGAIISVVASIVSLIGTLKQAKNAADLAEDSEFSYENIKQVNEAAERNGVDIQTAQTLVTDWENYQANLEEVETQKQAAYDKWFEENEDKVNDISIRTNLTGDDLHEFIIENATKTGKTLSEVYDITQQYQTTKNNMYDEWNAKHTADIDNYKQKTAATNELNAISTNVNDYIKSFDYSSYLGSIGVPNYSSGNVPSDSSGYASGGSIDVGTVDQVNKINGSVDIASEDLRYMRELAEQEAINQFTSKLIQPAINVSFGEVKETADVDGIVQRITNGLVESLNNSSDVVHI